MVYFDTDALHIIPGNLALPYHLRSNIVLSPISAIELLSKVARRDGERFFRSIRRMRNWLPNPPRVLDWPGYVIARALGGSPDSKIRTNIVTALHSCFNTTSFEEYIQNFATPIHDLGCLRDKEKQVIADTDSKFVGEVRAERFRLQDFPVQFVRSMAQGLGITLRPGQESEIVTRFSAHFEFRTRRLEVAANSTTYNFHKHVNDV